jgi:hypothetical protein
MKEMIGKWAFIIGLVISIIAGLVSIGSTGLAWLVILGIIVGLVNVTSKEVSGFLIATIALMMVGSVGLNIPGVGSFVTSVVSAFTAFVAGAAFIVAIKEVFAITKN